MFSNTVRSLLRACLAIAALSASAFCAAQPVFSAPTQVTATSPTASSMAIHWNPSYVTGITSTFTIGYNIYRSGTRVNSGTVYTTSYTDYGLAPATQYAWTVAATDGATVGPLSAAATGTTLAQPLAAPTGVSTSNATTRTMQISWNAVASNGTGTFSISYNVYRAGNKVNALPVYPTSFTDSNLTPATAYSWTVAAVDANGVQGAMSANAGGTTQAVSACTTASNNDHILFGRAHKSGNKALANGSNQNMGSASAGTITTLKMISANYYVIGTCP
ncbi:MAG: fibronectin type III domain-containing protein [Burkholderiales bacterium]|nr:fibronectin type III domain-containing protein [Burkholderiales bacterium]